MKRARKEPLPVEMLFDRSHPWRTLGNLYRGDWWRLGVSLLLFLVKHSPVWVLPIYTGWMVDTLTAGAFSPAHIASRTVGILGLILLNVPSNAFFARMLSTSVRAMEARVRMAQIRKLQQLSLNVQGTWPPGSLQNKVLRDVENLATLTTNLVNNIFPALVTVIIAVVMTLQKSPLLTLFFVIVAPLAMILRNAFSRRFNLRNATFRRMLEAMNSRVLEMIELLPVTRAHALEEVEIARTRDKIEEVRREGRSLDFTSAWFVATAWVVFMSAQIMSLVLMVVLASRGVLTVGQVLMFQSYFASVMVAMNGILNLMPELTRGAESIRSMGEILENADIEANVGKPGVVRLRGGFRFVKVAYRYPGADRDALSGIDFRVPAGAMAAITGESGSGKSTLMHLALGFLRPTTGRILLDGKDMAGFDLRTYRQRVATVAQHPLLFRGTVRDNISYGTRDLDEDAIWETLETLGAAEFVRGLKNGLDTEVGNQGAGLSGGQKQRIVMARALVRDPRVLILDEPTSALDAASAKDVCRAIAGMRRGRTVFLVTHRADTVGDVDIHVALAKGRIVGVRA